MKKIMAVMIVASMSSVMFLGCLGNERIVTPEEVILTGDQIPGEWTLVNRESENKSWDRQGGSYYLSVVYRNDNSTLEIDMATYGFTDRTEREFPRFDIPTDADSIPLGEEGYYWTSGTGDHVVHFKEWKVIVYSSLSVGVGSDLDGDWLIDLMHQQAERIPSES